MSSVQTPNHQITIFCLGIIWGSWKWTFLWDVVLESSLSHCATKVKEALTVAVLTEIRSAFNILQLFYTMFNCFQTCFPRWFALSSASVFAAVVLCVDFWHKAIGLKLAMLKQFESDQGRLKARSSSHRLPEKAGDIWWHLVTFGEGWHSQATDALGTFREKLRVANQMLGRSWKILEDWPWPWGDSRWLSCCLYAYSVDLDDLGGFVLVCWCLLLQDDGCLTAAKGQISPSISRSQEVGAFPGCTRNFQGPGRGEVFGWRAGSQTRTGRGETWWNMVRPGASGDTDTQPVGFDGLICKIL